MIDEGWLASHWYLLFPILGFAIAFYAITLQHRRSRALTEVMRAYAQSGKEPPAALTAMLRDH
jgi:hypothetical protein